LKPNVAIAPPDCCATGGRGLAPLVLTSADGIQRLRLELPSPRAALRHACPVVLEGVVAPLALFYVVLVTLGFRGALITALAWSYLALVWRLRRGERISMLLALGTILLTVRTVVSFITGSAFLYFAQPLATTVVASLVLVGSAIIGRPFTQRFAHDFCPIGPEVMARPRVQRFFIRISLLWAAVLMLDSGIVFWLLISSSLRAFVLERMAITYGLTAAAILLSITGFLAAMRGDGVTVVWGTGRRSQTLPATVA
jgi:Protein of unknown function (DUF3159)